jgi:DedD protein
MAEIQDVGTLKRRGRRRLVGAIAMVLVAVIVLPWIFDQPPRQAPPVSVRIPNEDESAFKPKPVPKPPAPHAEIAKPQSPAPEAVKPEAPKAEAPAKGDTSAPAAKPAPPPAQESAERARAEAALANAQYLVPVGAYADPEDAIAKLKAAKIPYFTERVPTEKGVVTRVRAGPYASRDAAERALKRLKSMGFKTGSVTTRP